jgi:hypothetical protein
VRLWLAILPAAVALWATSPASADEHASTVTVLTASGRQFEGQVAAESDDDRLWLVTRLSGITFLRRLAWGRIASGVVDGQDLPAAEFKRQALRLGARQSPTRLVSASPPAEIVPAPAGDAPAAVLTGLPTLPPLPPAGPYPIDRVESIFIDAYSANWDEDIEPDGLVLHLFAASRRGRPGRVEGSLEVQAVCERFLGTLRDQPRLADLGNWRMPVRGADFGPAGAVYRLEFQGEHPEFDLDLGPQAIVHARLTVPGHGTYHASQTGVRVRAYSALRDLHQQETGRRFLPWEATGPGR